MTGHPRRRPLAGSFVMMIALVVASLHGPSDAAITTPGVLAVTAYKDGAGELTLVAIDGSWRKPLREDGVQGERAAWSPDGTRIAYTRQYNVGIRQIWTTDVEGGDLRQLTRESDNRMAMDPAWSPDGRTLAYVGQGGTGDLFQRHVLRLVTIDGRNDRALITSDTFSADDPAWHPSGTHVAITGDNLTDNAHPGVWLINSDGSDLRPLLSDTSTTYREPAWSPDGTHLAFVAIPDARPIEGRPESELTITNQDGTGARVVARSYNADKVIWAPSWTADGRAIVFTNEGGGGQSGDDSVEIVNIDGSGRRVLLDGAVLLRAVVAPTGVARPGPDRGVSGSVSTPTTSRGSSTRTAERPDGGAARVTQPDPSASGGPASRSALADQGAHALDVSDDDDRANRPTVGVLATIMLLVACGLAAALTRRRRRRTSAGDADAEVVKSTRSYWSGH